jgi:hypothetical protein
VYYTNKQLKAIMEIRPNSSDGAVTFTSLGKALSIMSNTPTVAATIEEIQIRE